MRVTLVPWAQRLTRQPPGPGDPKPDPRLSRPNAVGNPSGGAFPLDGLHRSAVGEFPVPVRRGTLRPRRLRAGCNEIPSIFPCPGTLFGLLAAHDAPPARRGGAHTTLCARRDPMGDAKARASGPGVSQVIADPCRLTAMRLHSQVETDGSGDTVERHGPPHGRWHARGRARLLFRPPRCGLNHYYTRSAPGELEAKSRPGSRTSWARRAAYRRKVLRTVSQSTRARCRGGSARARESRCGTPAWPGGPLTRGGADLDGQAAYRKCRGVAHRATKKT